MRLEYRKNDVWLCDRGHAIQPLRIMEIEGTFLRHEYGWSTLEAWRAMAKRRIGRTRFVLGIPCGVIRD